MALPRDAWRAAAAIAGWRVAVNDRIRRPDRDRGMEKNRLNDIQGVMGELVGIRLVEQLVLGPLVIEHDLLDLSGPVDDVDIVVKLPADELRIETKCHLDAENKRLFLINARAHELSGTRDSTGYIPVLGSLGRARVCVGSMIPHADVDHWRVERFIDPARAIDLDDLCRSHFESSWDAIRRRIRFSAQVARPEELFTVFDDARRRLPRSADWRRLSAREIVQLTCDQLP